MNPPDLSTPALRNAFCLAHGIPGWLLFTPGEFAQIEMAHSRMKTEIGQWRLAARSGFGAKTPDGLTKAAQVRGKRAPAPVKPIGQMTDQEFSDYLTDLKKTYFQK